ncbi:HIT domain-containing protein [Ferrimonas gelatinilytica]|uniref:HIT domain-containing protein n=1 Tax=Ferrimonas gelatinilytica TaxID=1255257 RepID=A0ABP9S444_9GAMM
MFQLHPQLHQDSSLIGHLAGCQVRLHHDSRYPWLILIPECDGIREIHQLPQPLRQDTLAASCDLAELMQQTLQADKMNVAALGNMVPQLHIHHIARFEGDDAWPAPIWGALPAQLYPQTLLQAAIQDWRRRLNVLPSFLAAEE